MKRRWNPFRVFILSFTTILLSSGGGCGNGTTAVPSNQVARTALETALNSWRDGGKPGALAGTEPAVQVHDTPWASGQNLKSYEILREEAEGVEKRFAVRLNLAKPERVEEVEYHVMGAGPVLVFRDEDYQRNINMVDGPPVTKPKTSAERRR
jgi:hypothetical protein